MTIDDGMDPSEPVLQDRIGEIKSLTTLSRYELTPDVINSDLDSPHFGHPEIYSLQTSQETDFDQKYIHHSRILRFDGVILPRRLRLQNQYWGDSVFTRTINAIKNYNSANDSAVSALQDFSVGVFQIKNLASLIASGQEDIVRQRLELVNYSKSVIKSIVLDMEEKFEHQSKSLSGVPEVMKQASLRLVVASGMPHTKMLGESPSGLGADGQSEERGWYDYVKTQQRNVLRPRIDTLLRYIFLSKRGPTGGITPDKWSYEFNPLWQMSDSDQAKMEYVIAQKDGIYIQNGVCDPDEIARSRFGGEKFSSDTVIDLEARAKDNPLIGTEGSPEAQGEPGSTQEAPSSSNPEPVPQTTTTSPIPPRTPLNRGPRRGFFI
jgi:hypothetical protein